MDGKNEISGKALDALLAEHGPGSPAWFTRAHQALAEACPGEFVFRLDDRLEHLVEWLKETGVELAEETLLSRLGFDDDRDAPRLWPEGGSTCFHWQGRRYRTVSVRVPSRYYGHVYTWGVCPDETAAHELVDAVGRHARKQRSRVMVFDQGDWEEAPRLETDLARYSWDSIVLPEATSARLRRVTEVFFRSGDVYRELGIPWKLGFLLVGPPGTGKTLATKVLANTCGVPFLYVRRLAESGPDSSTLRDMFQGARDRAPCILCLEDVDSLVTENLRSTFLNELDGLEEDYRGVLTVATTNHPEKLDAALLHRPARFDYRIEFPLPDDGQRRAFVRHWTEKLAELGYVSEPDQATEEIVRRSRGMSHAYLRRVVVGTVLRMHTLDERGDEAFARLAQEELADAVEDRKIAHRAETSAPNANSGGGVGFRVD
ncbi:MAG TPA: ATP-binding protein [Armatimonadota bacterium]|nr:ATP-binding protein [Armatimonadota bacterium]